MEAAGLKIDRRWTASDAVEGGWSRSDGYSPQCSRAGEPTVVFCSSLVAAIGALAALREYSVAVPEQMSVIAFNDHEIADDTAPPLTTVRLPNLEMGREALRMTICAADGLPLSDAMIGEPIELIVRASTAAPCRSVLR